MNNETYIKARINTHSGMGSAFTPPNHPSQTHSIETDLERKKENRGCMSIEYALTQNYISPTLKKAINEIINEWENKKLPLTHPLTKQWIEKTTLHMGAAANAYIRKYYPDYK